MRNTKVLRSIFLFSVLLLTRVAVVCAANTVESPKADQPSPPVRVDPPEKISPVVVTSPKYADFVADARKAEKAKAGKTVSGVNREDLR